MSSQETTQLGWIPRSLFDLVTIRRGQVDPKISEYRNLPLIAPDHIEAGSGRLLKVETAGEQGAISGKYLVEPGDIVYSKIRPYLRKAYLAEFRSLCSADMYPLQPRPGVNGSFILNTLLGERFTSFAASTSMRSGIPKLNRTELAEFELAVPPNSEQTKIGEALADTDNLVAFLESLIAKKQAMKQGMMQELLTGKVRLPGFKGDWQKRLLGNHVIYLRTVPLSRAQLDNDSPLRYLHYGDVHSATGSTLDAKNTSMPRAPMVLAGNAGRLSVGDVVFADASEDTKGVGKSVEVISVPEKDLIPGLHTIAARFDKSVLADGFKAYLQFHPEFRKSLLRLVAGTKVLATTKSYISSISLHLPSVDEQRAIAGVIRDADLEIQALTQKLQKATAIKQGMMQELLTGRTRLPIKEASI